MNDYDSLIKFVASVLIAFVIGLVVGASGKHINPVVPGRYVQFGQTTVLLDTAKGEVCDLDPSDPVLPVCPQFKGSSKHKEYPAPQALTENKN